MSSSSSSSGSMTKIQRQFLFEQLKKWFLPCSEGFDGSAPWIDGLANIPNEQLVQSLAAILAAQLDYFPENLSSQIQKTGKTVTLLDLLRSFPIVVRFAPAPSGYLHLGHIVPMLLCTFLWRLNLNFQHESRFVMRLDDTNPTDAEDFGRPITSTFRSCLGVDASKNRHLFEYTRSSTMVADIIGRVHDSIISKRDLFYVDMTPQETIAEERKSGVCNQYRTESLSDANVSLWEQMKADTLQSGVVRAKIDMKHKQYNMRDPVVLRFVTPASATNTKVLMPTYDLVCPVLDALDAMRLKSVTIALRDCNYYDRLGQYIWMQRALGLDGHTAVLTFSRVNFRHALLSKRKIKQLVDSRSVDSWDDPRLLTLDGLFRRGVTMAGILNFYWLSDHLSVGNRSTHQDIGMFFAANDKILSHSQPFVLPRLRTGDTVTSAECFRVTVCKYATPENSAGEEDDTVNIPIRTSMGRFYSKKKDVASWNMRLLLQNNNNNNGEHPTSYTQSSSSFKLTEQFAVGETLKINNFKDEALAFPGYYRLVEKNDTDLVLVQI